MLGDLAPVIAVRSETHRTRHRNTRWRQAKPEDERSELSGLLRYLERTQSSRFGAKHIGRATETHAGGQQSKCERSELLGLLLCLKLTQLAQLGAKRHVSNTSCHISTPNASLGSPNISNKTHAQVCVCAKKPQIWAPWPSTLR